MRIAITGAAGRLGRVVTTWFADNGHDVLAIDRLAEHTPRGMESRDVDLTNPEAVAAAVKGSDAIVHLAAMRNPHVASAPQVFANNTQATFGVLTGAASVGVPRVIYASSGATYGMSYALTPVSPQYAPIDEQHPLQPADPYGLSKLVDEVLAAAIHRSGGPSMIGLRFPFVRDVSGLRAHAATLAQRPDLGARQLWAYLEVSDLARAIVRAVHADGIGSEVIGVAAGDTLSRVPSTELLRTYHPTTEVRAPLLGHAGLWNTTKAQRLLGWQPTISWREAESS